MEKMERLPFLRLAGISGAAAFVGGKYLGESAWAMTSRFDATLRLTSAGTVIASGPTGFAADETRARFYAHVAQGGRVQAGATGWVSGSTWSAVLTGPPLRRGSADAYGLAYVENQDGSYEWYPWDVEVTLRG
jgi:hypothetical protein